VKGNRYEGAIFPSDYQMLYVSNPSAELRFTPTLEEVAKLEEQLKKEIKSINKNKPNQGQNYGPPKTEQFWLLVGTNKKTNYLNDWPSTPPEGFEPSKLCNCY